MKQVAVLLIVILLGVGLVVALKAVYPTGTSEQAHEAEEPGHAAEER